MVAVGKAVKGVSSSNEYDSPKVFSEQALTSNYVAQSRLSLIPLNMRSLVEYEPSACFN